MAEDYYDILGVSRSATQDEIQKAYRELARKYHPDLNPDDKAAKAKFQEVQSAFDVLNDKEKRAKYDRFGAAYGAAGAGPGGENYTWAGGGEQFQDVDLGDIFGAKGQGGGGFADFFQHFGGGGGFGAGPGAGPRTQRPARGADLRHELTVPFTTAVLGGEAQVTVQRRSGKTETLSVKIPAGIESGKKIRLRGQGEPGRRGGPAGDILIQVNIASHPHFTRTGNRLDVEVPVTLEEAARGAKIDVPTPKGVITLTIPAGTSSGKKLRVKGHGVAPASQQPGDLYAELRIVLPEDLDEEDLEWIRQIGEKHPGDPRSDLKW